jgi:opacity protein-like surface antigen
VYKSLGAIDIVNTTMQDSVSDGILTDPTYGLVHLVDAHLNLIDSTVQRNLMDGSYVQRGGVVSILLQRVDVFILIRGCSFLSNTFWNWIRDRMALNFGPGGTALQVQTQTNIDVRILQSQFRRHRFLADSFLGAIMSVSYNASLVTSTVSFTCADSVFEETRHMPTSQLTAQAPGGIAIYPTGTQLYMGASVTINNVRVNNVSAGQQTDRTHRTTVVDGTMGASMPVHDDMLMGW